MAFKRRIGSEAGKPLPRCVDCDRPVSLRVVRGYWEWPERCGSCAQVLKRRAGN